MINNFIHLHLPKRYWLCYSVCLFLMLGFGLLFPSHSASAVNTSGTVHTFTEGFRTYQITGSSPVIANPFDRSAGDFIFLGGSGRYFSGYRFTAPLSLSSSDDYWTLMVTYTVSFPNWFYVYSDYVTDFPFEIGINGVLGSCTTSASNNVHITATCTISAKRTDIGVPTAVGLRFGSVDSFVPYWQGMPNSDSIIILSDLYYEFSSYNDASTILLQQQLASQQETNSLLREQISAQQESNQQQIDQYEAEKAEESEREDSASDDIDSLNSTFSFAITDPLSYIFDSFTSNNNCVSIPTIAGMLNSSETTYCPWFSSSVRNTLTPVFSTIVTVLCYGFLVSWLRKGDN